jgi:sulfite dehydrogenase
MTKQAIRNLGISLKSPSRRHLLTGSTALTLAGLAGLSKTAVAQVVAGTTAAKPLPSYVAWKDPEAMIVHTSGTLETKRSAFGTSIITPSEQLYIRNNLPAPDAAIVSDRDGWELVVEGIENPRTGDGHDGAAVLGEWSRTVPEQAKWNGVEGRRSGLRGL